MNEELEKWLQDFVHRKRQQGIDCKLSPYQMGKNKKFMFEVNGEFRNIENYFTIAELQRYKKLSQIQKTTVHIR